MAAKKQLSEDVKRFIVRSLAVYESPSDVMLSVKEKFKVTLTRAGIQNYDPTKVAGEELSDDLKKLFFDTRKAFDETEIIPVSKKLVRLKKLEKYVEVFENFENYTAAAAVLEQIAKEEGGMFTNKQKIEQSGTVETVGYMLAEWKAEQAKRREQAAQTKQMFESEK